MKRVTALKEILHDNMTEIVFAGGSLIGAVIALRMGSAWASVLETLAVPTIFMAGVNSQRIFRCFKRRS